MRTAIGLLSVTALLVALSVGVVLSQQTPVEVVIQDFEFSPAIARSTVAMEGAGASGSNLRWVNRGPSTHWVTADRGAFDSGALAPGATFTFTVKTEGVLEYHCNIHPSMKGQIVVEKASAKDDYGY